MSGKKKEPAEIPRKKEEVDSGNGNGGTKEELEEIKEDVQEIMEEVSDSSRDVDELREDVEEIKEDISEMTKATKGFKSMMEKIGHRMHIHIPSKFSFSDIAQQMVGAIILSTPFSVTSEVWELAHNLDIYRVGLIIFLTVFFDILLIYFTKFQNIDLSNLASVFARIVSLIIISYTAAALILYIFGVIGNQVTDFWWALRLVILVGLFANIGAGTADILK
ncbi:MAG: DUF2391 family protein [Candidatus Diapherotrites archaeon]|nr:DUF2391 family protein [Candidatus Diapherotrites archaeon]